MKILPFSWSLNLKEIQRTNLCGSGRAAGLASAIAAGSASGSASGSVKAFGSATGLGSATASGFGSANAVGSAIGSHEMSYNKNNKKYIFLLNRKMFSFRISFSLTTTDAAINKRTIFDNILNTLSNMLLSWNKLFYQIDSLLYQNLYLDSREK